MSKLICNSAIQGAEEWVTLAESKLNEALGSRGESQPVGFPDTAYFLPIIYSFTGEQAKTLGDLKSILKQARGLLPEQPSEKVWLPYLGSTLDAGVASLFACEIIEACKYIMGPHPVQDIWLGAASDLIMRERGIEFVDGTAPGFAAVTGAAPTNEIAVKIARELQEKNLYVFMGGGLNGKSFAEQLAEEGIQLGWETRLVPFGKGVSSLVYALGFANRAALSFGRVEPGDFTRNLRYNKNRIFAFVLALGEVTPDKYALASGAINYGFPVIADTSIPEILPTGICTYEHVVSGIPHDNIVEKALEVRGCKIKITKVPIPVSYSPAFEGERIRKPDVHVEFGGNITPAFEFVTSVQLDEINDRDIQVIGPDIDTVEVGSALPLGIWVEVAGRKMQSDFEPILERQIHHLINGAEGIWHMGQRDIVWTRVSQDGFTKGLRLKHYGEILHTKFLSEYPAIVDKVKVTLITDKEEVEKRIKVARQVYDERNRRLESMTDESVETFYSCLLCQSFAPNHVCIITPERLGLCGAYNWLDGKAAYEINETGPNQPVQKGYCFDPVKGIWKGIDDYVYINSHKTINSFSAYSIMDRPMTSCGCFEVICAYVPECNGIMAVNREFTGDTPVGMTFATLAGSVGGGQQTPGFMGCGKVFLFSKKFLYADGGHRRIVWMTKELKDLLAQDLNKRFEEQGVPDMLGKIADETIATDAHEIKDFMERVNHPALKMEDMALFAESVSGPTNKPKEEVELAEEAKQESHNQEGPKKSAGESESEVVKNESTHPLAAKRFAALNRFEIPQEKCEEPVWTVTLGASTVEGGTRGKTLTIGGESCMPFQLWEGKMPYEPLVAMEVFDQVSDKFPQSLRDIYGDLLGDAARMARVCVDKYDADLISVRLESTHPEKGNSSPAQAVKLVKEVLSAVDVPLIVTGHSHFESNNEMFKAVAKGCAGENLLLNWVEQDNYRTIAGAALAYGHSIVSQSPIDVNIAKQMNILLTNMDIKPGQIVMDPMTGATGYGIEYTYSVMERIRQTALNGDSMLAGPMVVTPGQECVKIKESRAAQEDFPAWGDLSKRFALWELATAMSLLYAGGDLFIMYHPQAVKSLKRAIYKLMNN
jgi:acetyl-CoA synthase